MPIQNMPNMMCSQRVREATVRVLKLRPPSIRAAITTASTNPMIRGHLTVVNGFMRFPFLKLCVGLATTPPRRGSCDAAGWKNRGLTPIIQRMSESTAPPVSPCVKNCTLDANGYCRGCYRTIEEIGGWQRMSHPEQRAVLRALGERRERSVLNE